jgi:hypothetical protein
MRNLNISLACVLVASLFVTGCGGGVEVGVVVSPPPPSAAFDVGARLNGHRLQGVDVFPDDQQTIQVQTGDVLELDSSGPVSWETVAGSAAGIPTQTGGTLLYQGVAFSEAVSTPGQLILSISANQPLVAPVSITVYATSLEDAYQTARFDIVVTD